MSTQGDPVARPRSSVTGAASRPVASNLEVPAQASAPPIDTTDPVACAKAGLCPQCTTRLSGEYGYVRWCPACEWNIDGGVEPIAAATNRMEAIYRRLSTRNARELMTEVCRPDQLRRRRDRDAWLAICLALPVHLLSVGALVVAGWLAVWVRGPVEWVVAAVLVGIAFLGRPRIERPPADGIHLCRDDAPTLFAVCDRVSEATAAPPLAIVSVVEDFNAFAGRVGLRRYANLTIGARWWAAAARPSRLATVGHEFGHFSNGDWSHQAIVSSALTTLDEWYHAFGDGLPADGLVGVIEAALGRLVRAVTGSWYWLIYIALARAGQRAEYLADAMAVTVAGTDAEILAEQDLLAGPSVDLMIVSAVATTVRAHRGFVRDEDLAIWSSVGERARHTPTSELERRLRASKRSQTRVDDSHPPTWMRIEAVRSRPHQAASVIVTDAEWAAIDAELAPAMAAVERHVFDETR